MMNHYSIIFIGMNFCLLIQCPVVQTKRIQTIKEICVENQFPTLSINYLKICYYNEIQDQSSLVWFTIGQSLNDTFDFYRFVLRSMDYVLSSSIVIKTLTNFTELVDFNNSLRMFHLDTGEYEVCIEFRSTSPSFIYQPRDGCILIHIGQSPHETFKHSSTPLLVALASAIVIFFILGLVVQWVKGKQQKKSQEDNQKSRSRSSSILSSIPLRLQRDRLVRNLFHRHIDQPRTSRMRQWARNHAFRHRIATYELDFDQPKLLRRWNKDLFTSTDPGVERNSSSEPNLNTNHISTISEREHRQITPRKTSFYLSPPEEHQF